MSLSMYAVAQLLQFDWSDDMEKWKLKRRAVINATIKQ